MLKKLLLLVLILPTFVQAQEKIIPIQISILNESTAIPYTRFFTTPIHPGFQIGTEHVYSKRTHVAYFQTLNFNYFYHRHLAQGLGLYTEFGYEYRFNNGIVFASLLGLGYMHTFATTEEYTFSNGKYEKKADRGNARLYPSFSIDVGYYLKKKEKDSPKIFIRYQSWLEYPYSPDFIPVMTHINFHVGYKFFLKLKKTNHE